jgi:hypothetical protein
VRVTWTVVEPPVSAIWALAGGLSVSVPGAAAATVAGTIAHVPARATANRAAMRATRRKDASVPASGKPDVRVLSLA